MSTADGPEENRTPQLWSEHRADTPAGTVVGAKVYVDDKLAGEIPGAEIYDVDTEWLRERFVPADGRPHQVRIHWLKAGGKGNLPLLRFEVGARGQPPPPDPTPGEAPPTDIQRLIDAVTSMARESMSMSERMVSTVQAGMAELAKTQLALLERDFVRSRDSREREEQRLHAQTERDLARYNAEAERAAARENNQLQMLMALLGKGDLTSTNLDDLKNELVEKMGEKLSGRGDLGTLLENAAPLLQMVLDSKNGSK